LPELPEQNLFNHIVKQDLANLKNAFNIVRLYDPTNKFKKELGEVPDPKKLAEEEAE